MVRCVRGEGVVVRWASMVRIWRDGGSDQRHESGIADVFSSRPPLLSWRAGSWSGPAWLAGGL